MAKRTRKLITAGSALASAVAIVVAAPAVTTGNLGGASVPTQLKLSTAKYELAALTDITPQGLADAFQDGWGGYVGCWGRSCDPYWSYFPEPPVDPANVPVYVNGLPRVAYYVTVQAIRDVGINNYFFEAGLVPAIQVTAIQAAGGAGPLDFVPYDEAEPAASVLSAAGQHDGGAPAAVNLVTPLSASATASATSNAITSLIAFFIGNGADARRRVTSLTARIFAATSTGAAPWSIDRHTA